MTEGDQIKIGGNIHIKKKIIHYYEVSSKADSKSSGMQAEHQKKIKPKYDHEKATKKEILRKLLSPWK